MKPLLILCIILSLQSYLTAQGVAINETNAPPETSALLDVSSTTKGILVPRMTGLQRFMLISPAEGLLVYDTDSRSFWFYANGWNEIAAGGSLPSGPASGDLSGNYPSPTVAKIQNLEVSPAFPFDRQVLKWDNLSNNWAARNDSLFLPYNVAYGSPTKLFGIQNNNTTGGSSAVFGRSGNTGSGVNPAFTMGIWGDNSTGAGVVGTSNAGIGSYGFSFQNHGMYGLSVADQFAGVYGTTSSSLGIGVLGDVGEAGIGIYGKSTGLYGAAGLFVNTNVDNAEDALKVFNLGAGTGANIINTSLGFMPLVQVDNHGLGNGLVVHTFHPSSTLPSMLINNNGKSGGISCLLNSQENTDRAIDVYTHGSGNALYASSNLGPTAEFINDNQDNDTVTLHATTLGRGTAGVFAKNNTTGSISDIHDPAVLIENNSKGAALHIEHTHTPSVEPALEINHNGQAPGINVVAPFGGLSALTTDAEGTSVLAVNWVGGIPVKAFGHVATKGAIVAQNSHMFGIGVESSVTGSQSYAFKGTANSDGAAVWAINDGSGEAIKAQTNAFIGYAVLGQTGSESWGIPGHFISNCPDASTNTLWVRDMSKGQTVRIQVDNEFNDKEVLYAITQGTGKLASLNNSDGEVFAVGNTGNVTTDGNITVKSNKGIVRNSTSTQLRMETVTSPVVTAANLTIGGAVTVTVNFASAFSSPPTVTIANISTGFAGPCDALSTAIKDVTTTGCTLRVFNTYIPNTGVFSGTWKLLVVGAE